MQRSATLPAPDALLFDWHGTLVDTHDAMFAAMEDMLPQLEDLGLVDQLLPEADCKTTEDAKLVRYIRIFRRLHPRILAERRVSRTDIFNAIFGHNKDAKAIAHKAYNQCYRKYFGAVKPLQDGISHYLEAYRSLGLKLGVSTNRNREFLDHELAIVDEGRWQNAFDCTICAGDITQYKPDPEVILNATAALEEPAGPATWYVGDSYVDMVTAKNAGVTAIYFNGAQWDDESIEKLFEDDPDHRPDRIVHSFEELTDAVGEALQAANRAAKEQISAARPAPFPPPEPPPPRIEPDWHPSVANLTKPRSILFDWHATLVDTLDAMYHAVDDMLPEFEELGLMDALTTEAHIRSPEDARLVDYVRSHAQLHPKVRADRKISRTDIFEVLFADDQDAKARAHKVFNKHYRNHYGSVLPFEPQVRRLLEALNQLPITVGVITNRDREFFEHELNAVEDTGWTELFHTNVCGDDTPLRKPHPDQLLLAAEKLDETPDPGVWYVGDSTTDIIAAKRAGMTAVFFNGAQWDLPWLNTIFPGTEKHPYKPDVVVNDFSEFWALVLACMGRRETR